MTGALLEPMASRWSPRGYDPNAEIPQADLDAILEAARWAPSAYNAQPWRFALGRRGDQIHTKILETLVPFNQGWAQNASVLLAAIAIQEVDGRENPTALYDTGQAMAHANLQAIGMGYGVRQMSGFDHDALAERFALEAGQVPVAVMAIGTISDDHVPAEFGSTALQADRQRLPVAELLLG